MGEEKTVDFGDYLITDHGNGLSTITVPDQPPAPEPPAPPPPGGFFARILRWFRESPVTPYVRVKDLADPFGDRRRDPFDADAGSDGRLAGEIGIKIKF